MKKAFQNAVEEIMHSLQRLNTTKLDKSYVEGKIARSIGQLIYDLPHIRSGWVSKSLLRDGFWVKGTKGTNEHYNSRQWSGVEIIRVWRDGQLTEERLYEMLQEFCRVHVVTSKENIALGGIQKNYPEKTPEEQYGMACMEMVYNPPSAPSWWWGECTVKGHKYESMIEAAKKINIDITDLKYRCKSTTKKWNDYQ